MSDGPVVGLKQLWTVCELALVTTAIMLALAYPGMSLLREVLGQRGLATSPLLLGPVVFLVLAIMIACEDWVQAQRYWSRLENYWYAFAVGTGMVLPVVVGVVRPLAVLEGLPRGVPTLVSIVPMALVYYLFYKMGVAAKAHLRDLKRREGEQ